MEEDDGDMFADEDLDLQARWSQIINHLAGCITFCVAVVTLMMSLEMLELQTTKRLF